MDHNCTCEGPPLTRDDVLNLAYGLLESGAEEAQAGRAPEAQAFVLLAQTAIALAERTVPASLSGPVH